MEHLPRIARADAIPAGSIVVDDRVPSTDGRAPFQTWLASAGDPLCTPCECGWAPQLGQHFRLGQARL